MQRSSEVVVGLMFVVAAIAGSSGACLVIANKIMHGRMLPVMVAAAYAIVGAVMGVAFIAYVFVFWNDQFEIAEVVLYSMIAGGIGSLALAATNLTSRFIMRRLGIEVDISVKRIDPKDRNG